MMGFPNVDLPSYVPLTGTATVDKDKRSYAFLDLFRNNIALILL
jgi:hypothetical protein